MNTYSITIQPLSPFGTPLKGDTLFGHLCWQLANDAALLAKPLDEAIAAYPEQPFAIFSSAFPSLPDGAFALKRPDAPLDQLFNFNGMSKESIIENRKKLKKQKWLVCDKSGAMADFKKCLWLNDDDLSEKLGLADCEKFQSEAEFSHNSINRLTGTTGSDGFAPFTQDNVVYATGSRLVIFVAIDETLLPLESLKNGLQRIGTFGFGRDASTGLGKFSIMDCKQVDLKSYGSTNANALYTLSPSVPDATLYKDAMFSPFTRFGRHGDLLAVSGKPFKNPIIMADEGALLFPKDMAAAVGKTYLGTAVTGISKIQENAVSQGYSLHIPVRLEEA